MKNEEEEPKEYFERNVVFVFAVISSGLFLDWLCFYLLQNTNPWGMLIGVPGLTVTLQGLWLLVNPYAIVYDDRFEIKQSLIFNREFYYLDAKTIKQKNSGSLSMTYNDGDILNLSLIGMREKHKVLFLEKLQEKIAKSVEHRDF